MHDDDNGGNDDDTINKMPTFSNSLFPQYIFEFGIIRLSPCYIHTASSSAFHVPLCSAAPQFLLFDNEPYGFLGWCGVSAAADIKKTHSELMLLTVVFFFHSFFIGAHDVTFCWCLFNTIFEYAGSWGGGEAGMAFGVLCQWCGRAKKNIIDYPVR